MTVKHSLSIISASCALLASSAAFGHAFVSQPESRGYFCNLGVNTQCGSVQYEPQSIEGKDGFPDAGPVAGEIASGGNAQFSQLNIQTNDRWQKSNVQAGPFAFEWTFRAPHKANNWRYYLTKQNWNINSPITRDSLELTPFCQIDGQGKLPPKVMTHQCTLPERTGYQVILAVWEVGDTTNSFYNVIDVQFTGEAPESDWAQGGTIYPSIDLNVGDTVKTRVFDSTGELPGLQTTLMIESQDQGERNQWSHALATKINAEQENIKAGQKDQEDNINPVYGQNTIYLSKTSNLTRVEIDIEQQAPIDQDSFTLTGLASDYTLDVDKVTINFDISVEGNLEVTNTVYDHQGNSHGQSQADIKDSSLAFTMPLTGMEPGHHMLVVKTKSKDSGEELQQSYDFFLNTATAEGDFDFEFPQSIASYTEGTKVYQPKTDKVYQCKAYPYSGYCGQWSENATQYEPGVGTDWQSAWDEVQ